MVIPAADRPDFRPGRDLGQRLGQVAAELFGDDAPGAIAAALGLPRRTWGNYEAGVAIPGPTLLAFLVLTSAEPAWLLTGEGPRYRPRPA